MKAMKLVDEDGKQMSPQQVINLTQEAITLCRLEHPHIIKYYDSFAFGDIFYCVVTEFCEGGDLSKRLESYSSEKKNITNGQLVKWIMELVSALEYLHKGLWWVVYFLSLNILFIDNFVHRDIKPQYA